MTTSHWCRPHTFKSSDLATDVLIIGGGYAGLSTAYWITEMKPGLRVTVLEKSHIGAGASGRNAGFLTKGSAAFYRSLSQKWGRERAIEIFKFAQESIEMVAHRILKSSPEVKADRASSLTLFMDDSLPAKWKEENFDPSLFNYNWVDGQSLPEGISGPFYGAYENEMEFKVNPAQLLISLKKNLESKKVQLVEGVGAFKLTQEGVVTELNQIKAKQVVLALNGYLPQFHSAFKDHVVPCRAQMLAVESVGPFNCPSLHFDPAERVYWRMSTDNLLLIGGKRLLDEVGEMGDFEKISPAIQDGLENYLSKRLKLQFKVIHRWSGIMGFTENELPFISRVGGELETFAIGGFSGHGMGFGFHAGREMAELLCGNKNESFFDQFGQVKINL